MSTSSTSIQYLDSAEAFSAALQQEGTTVVDFWAPWCGPCVAYGPTVEAYAADAPDTVHVAKANVDEVPDLARQYGIRSIPTTIFFRNGEVVDRANGVLNADELRRRAEAL